MGETNNYNGIQPSGEDFRWLPFEEAFTWEKGLPYNSNTEYIVRFFSIRDPDAEPGKIKRLLALDDAAFMEARSLPGFGTYWHDDKLEYGVGLPFCLWDSPEAAQYAASQAKHRLAVNEGLDLYSYYEVSAYFVHRQSEAVVFEQTYLRPIGNIAFAGAKIIRDIYNNQDGENLPLAA